MDFVNLIKEVGGPIAVIIILGIWYAKKDRQHKEEREQMDKLHREERLEWKRTIENQFEQSNRVASNSTQALTELSTLVKSMKK